MQDIFNVQVEWGTPTDYYEEISRRERAHAEMGKLPTLHGDFFTYSDGVYNLLFKRTYCASHHNLLFWFE